MASKNAHARRALHLTIMPGHVRPNHAYKALANSPRAPLASSGGGAHAVARGCGAVGAVAKGCGAVNANAVGGGGSVASGCGVVRAVARVGGAFVCKWVSPWRHCCRGALVFGNCGVCSCGKLSCDTTMCDLAPGGGALYDTDGSGALYGDGGADGGPVEDLAVVQWRHLSL